MNKEPTGLIIFRFILMAAALGFAALIYWSTSLLEQDLKSLRTDMVLIKNEIRSLRDNGFKLKNDTLIQQGNPQTSLADASLPNLLTIDPFYQTTLPKLLGPDFAPHGIRRESELAKPENLHPFANWAYILNWLRLCNIAVASSHFGIYETYAPAAAYKMELRKDKDGGPEYWIHLRQDLFWQPLKQEHFPNIPLAPMFLEKHQVTAHDFKFYFDALMNPHIDEKGAVALRTYYNDVREIEVINDFTFVVRWNTELVDGVQRMKYTAKMWTGALQPLASFVYKYFPDGSKIIEDDSDPNTYRTNLIWAQNFSRTWANNIIVSCGPWIFDGLTEREIRFKRNGDYPLEGAPLTDALEFKLKDSASSIWEEFKGGAFDQVELAADLLPEAVEFLQSAPYRQQAKKGLGIKRLDFVDRVYYYIGWNQANVLFQNRKVRQALTMSIDRKRIIKQILNGMGIEITGPFFVHSPAYDSSIEPFPYDPSRAKAILEEEGWYDRDGDGVIDNIIDGKRVPFSFSLTYYVKSSVSKSICEYIQTALKEVGIECRTNGVDLADLSAVSEDKSFEAIYLGWGLGTPPEDPTQLWSSAGAKEKGSSNMVGFANAEVDEIIRKLRFEDNTEKRIALYHRFDRIIHEEAPYTFLFNAKRPLLYREYLQNVFIPADRQDLIPGANVGEPQPSIYWIN